MRLRGKYTRYSNWLHDFSITIPRCYKDVSVKGSFPRTTRFCNSLSAECLPLNYGLNNFKSRVNRHLLLAGYFYTVFLIDSNLYPFLFLATPTLAVTIQLFVEWIPIKKTAKNKKTPNLLDFLSLFANSENFIKIYDFWDR